MRQIGWKLNGVRRGLNLPSYIIVGINTDGKPIQAPRACIGDHAKPVWVANDPDHDSATHKVVDGVETDNGDYITVAREIVALSAGEIGEFETEEKRQARRRFMDDRVAAYGSEFGKIYDAEGGIALPLTVDQTLGHLMDTVIEQAEANRVAAGATATAEWLAILAARAKVKRDVPRPN